MKGLLSIKGKVKNIEILFETTSSSIGILFTGQFTINRRDFDVGGSSISLSDDSHKNTPSVNNIPTGPKYRCKSCGNDKEEFFNIDTS